MNIRDLAKLEAEKEFTKENMSNADMYAYEYYIKGYVKGYEAKEQGVEPLPFGEGNVFEKY